MPQEPVLSCLLPPRRLLCYLATACIASLPCALARVCGPFMARRVLLCVRQGLFQTFAGVCAVSKHTHRLLELSRLIRCSCLLGAYFLY